jgi:hypothetical protein
MDELQKETLMLEFQTHIKEERLEREQYYKARTKAVKHPDRYLSLMIDSMDPRKTRIPFFLNLQNVLDLAMV